MSYILEQKIEEQRRERARYRAIRDSSRELARAYNAGQLGWARTVVRARTQMLGSQLTAIGAGALAGVAGLLLMPGIA
ncbi:MAG: hypothetical protein WEB00_11060 [Dehalococcoidia bacterium]